MGSAIKKAFKKVTNNVLGTVGLAKDAPAAVDTTDAATTAAPVDTPTTTDAPVTETETAGEQKRTKRVGKGSLQVTRNSGGGLSV